MASDRDAVLAELLALARAHGIMIATAESCTGGLIAAHLTRLPGSSDMFDRGFVTYTNAAKAEMLGISEATLAAHGAVSEPVAAQMASGAIARSNAEVAVSVTGIAGPGGSDHKPEGRVCFALCTRDMPEIVETLEFGAIGRDAVREATVDHGLGLLLSHLKKISKS